MATRLHETMHAALYLYLRKFPINRGKYQVMNRLWEPLAFGNYRRETRLEQADIRIQCDITKWVQRHLYFLGSYEKEHCALWMNLARSAEVVFDLGANVGLYSLLAARVNPRCRVHAFEPTPELVEALRRNREMNALNNIVINPVAVGRQAGEGYLHRCLGDNGSNEGMNFVTADSASDTTRVPVLSIADYCRQNGIEHIDLLKLDIEGGEYGALLGAAPFLQAQAIRWIFVEVNGWAAERSGWTIRELYTLLRDNGYKIYRQVPGALIALGQDEIPPDENAIACPAGPNRILL